MQYIVADLEWNGSYTKKAHGYFNEIIEVGAVKLDESLRITDRYQAVIRPAVSKKLSGVVTDLTSITAEELADGTDFPTMVRELSAFIGDGPAALLTWSTSDLLVLMENCRFFFGQQEIPFLHYYLDLQAYAQTRMGISAAQQLGLARAGELLEIPEDALSLHRAPDDSLLTAHILQKVCEPDGLARAVQPADEEFYRRITFKTTVISDIRDPQVRRSELDFSCPECGRGLRAGEWRFHHRAFCAELHCPDCRKDYCGRVQFRIRYEGVECRRKLSEKRPKPEPEENTEAAAAV